MTRDVELLEIEEDPKAVRAMKSAADPKEGGHLEPAKEEGNLDDWDVRVNHSRTF